jgi:hypothetical protein
MLKSSGPRVNLGRMAELEASLRGLLAEAETGSRALTDHLMRRQKDLEKLLFELEGAQGRTNRHITTAEELRGKLEIAVERAQTALRAMQNGIPDRSVGEQRSAPAVELREEQPVTLESVVTPSATEVEPPSFHSVQVSAKLRSSQQTEHLSPLQVTAQRSPSVEPSRLQSQIERQVFETPEGMNDLVARPLRTPRRSQRPSAVERAMAFQRVQADESRELGLRDERMSARAMEQMERAGLLEKAPAARPAVVHEKTTALGESRTQEFMDLEGLRSAVLSPEEAATASGEDPRLGVLGGAPIRRQVQVL